MDAVAVKKNIPNYITVMRIIGTVCLLFVEPLSITFYVVYSLAGITDVIDGWLARKLKTTSEHGAKMDSIADILFYAVMLIKIFPVLWKKLPIGVWIAIAAILGLRVCSYVVALLKYKSFASLHTYMNKMTGLAVFMVPYIIEVPAFVSLCVAACVIAGLATVEELLIHIVSKGHHTNVKSIWEV